MAMGTLEIRGGSARIGTSDSPFIVFPLERNIRISTFPTPLPNPLTAYRPSYTTLPDGSLLTQLYKADLYSANSRLFGVGALLTLGAVNVWTCVSFIRRGKVKDKTLFYLLLASQLLLPVCFSALLAPFFLDNVNCSIVNTIAVGATVLSYAIMITGILGLKAYRCLSKSRVILVVVWILQLAILALFALDIRGIDSPRRISGSCSTDGVLRFTPIALMLTVIETLFLALCFLYAVWKSTLYPAAQGRLSIAISEKPPMEDDRDDTVRRGWWDYVPRAPPSEAAASIHPGTSANDASGGVGRPSHDSIVKRLRDSVMRLTTSMELQIHQYQLHGPSSVQQHQQPQQPLPRKPSIPTEHPLSQPPRPNVVSHQAKNSQISEKEMMGRLSGFSNKRRFSDVAPSARTTSVKSVNFSTHTGTTNRSWRIDPLQPLPPRESSDSRGLRLTEVQAAQLSGKRLPAVLEVRAVIKDEMIYTTIIMLSCVLAAVLAVVRARVNDVVFGPSVWLGANWAAVSLLIMRSFSRVVRRHEREAILQSPSAFGGPLSRNDFNPAAAATAMARRRRDAVALAGEANSAVFSPLEQNPSRRRRLARRSSWDYISSVRPGQGGGYAQSLFDDNASLRRKEGLRAWDEEKRRKKMMEADDNPFSDFHEIAGFGNNYDVEEGDIGRRKSGECPLGFEELVLETDSMHRGTMRLPKPLIASPWIESPFTYVGSNNGDIADIGPMEPMPPIRRGSGTKPPRSLSPLDTSTYLTRRPSNVPLLEPSPVSISSSFRRGSDDQEQRYLQPYTVSNRDESGLRAGPGPRSLPNPVGGLGRRAAITTLEKTDQASRSSSPSPPSHNGSSIEMLEQTSTHR